MHLSTTIIHIRLLPCAFMVAPFTCPSQRARPLHEVRTQAPTDFTSSSNHSLSYSVPPTGQGGQEGSSLEVPPSKVLMFTIQNPLYPVSLKVLHTICAPHSAPLRISILRHGGFQAFIEFDSIDNARRVKAALNGADIYAGCCTIKIEFAKVSDRPSTGYVPTFSSLRLTK